MNRTPDELKQRITSLFDKSKYLEYIDIDPGIKDLMQEINSYPHIMTKHSCEGHEQTKDNQLVVSGPYFAFLVDEEGWNIFWTRVAPILASGRDHLAKVSVSVYESNGVDYSMLAVHGPHMEHAIKNYKQQFWKLVKRAFKELK